MNTDEPIPKTNSHLLTGLKIFAGILVVTGVFFGGVAVGYTHSPATDKITSVIHKESPITQTTDFNPFWKAWAIVDEKFADANKISSEDRMYAAIKGMLSSFNDPYTTFFPPSENTVFQTEIAGTFDGIGIEIGQKDDVLTVIAPLKDTPADKAGIKSGDKITAIGDTSTTNLSIDKAITLIRGASGTPVNLSIFRQGFTEPKVFTIMRGHISLPTVDTEKRPDQKAFIIHLYNFSAQSPELFHQALEEYIASGYPNLLLDLRGNPGGYLDAAVSIGGWFIPEGKTIVKEIGKTPDDVTVHTSKGPLIFPAKSKLVILVDKGSASASEILAGALSEQGIGLLAGEQTYGKGSVQEVIKLTRDTSLKVTVAKWYTPNGVSISKSGLTPSVKIPYVENKDGVDAQLESAIGLFVK
jgi:carboxyl-terminal processing protease